MHNYYLHFDVLSQLLMQIWFSKVNLIITTHYQSSHIIFQTIIDIFFKLVYNKLVMKLTLVIGTKPRPRRTFIHIMFDTVKVSGVSSKEMKMLIL